MLEADPPLICGGRTARTLGKILGPRTNVVFLGKDSHSPSLSHHKGQRSSPGQAYSHPWSRVAYCGFEFTRGGTIGHAAHPHRGPKQARIKARLGSMSKLNNDCVGSCLLCHDTKLVQREPVNPRPPQLPYRRTQVHQCSPLEHSFAGRAVRARFRALRVDSSSTRRYVGHRVSVCVQCHAVFQIT